MRWPDRPENSRSPVAKACPMVVEPRSGGEARRVVQGEKLRGAAKMARIPIKIEPTRRSSDLSRPQRRKSHA
jgi:hypothetical protein